MARIRSIKPEFWTDEKVVSLSPLARLLFIGMWNFVDDEGRGEYSPLSLKLKILPADSADIRELLAEIRGEGLINVYVVDGKEYFEVCGFAKHQKIDKRSPSKLPAPSHSNDEQRQPTPNSPEFPRTPTTDQGVEGKGREGKDSSLRSERARLHSGFEEWWAAYPHKVGKGAAEKAYRSARKTVDLETLKAGVRRYVRQKPTDRAWCNPATWLNQRRWEDAPADLLAQPASSPKANMITLLNGKEVTRDIALSRCAKFFRDPEIGRRDWRFWQVLDDVHPPDHPNTVYPQEIVEEAKRLAREAA